MRGIWIACAVLVAVSGCATPEQREARRVAKAQQAAMAMSPARLCKALLFDADTYWQYSKAVTDRGIDCSSPQMQNAVALVVQQDMANQESQRRAAGNMQNYGMQMLMQNRQAPIPVTCNTLGTYTTCY